jgi:hypothetical protein
VQCAVFAYSLILILPQKSLTFVKKGSTEYEEKRRSKQGRAEP